MTRALALCADSSCSAGAGPGVDGHVIPQARAYVILQGRALVLFT